MEKRGRTRNMTNNYLYTYDMYMQGMKSKMSRNCTLKRIFEIKLDLRHFTFHPQYYFSVKLIAKKRQVKIRQKKIKKIHNTFNPGNGG